VHTAKFERTPDGREMPVDINEPLQIVVADGSIDDSDRYGARVLADTRQWFDQESVAIELIVEEKPVAVIVDPYHNFVERNLDDNVRRL
jgi:hypothetical protein